MDLKDLIQKMTLEEKASMCSGKDFWHLKGVERLGIPSVMVSDGPHGLRKQDQNGDHLGINDSIKAVCFPAACATASSFDKELLYDMGVALGKECQAEDVSVVLGPAVNIKRSPLCGRNFEYFSEDPYLTGELAASYVSAVQSMNVGTSVKHFAANNQERLRMTISSEVDERTLREIYYTAFETIVKKAKPWTIMCSYNKINGEFASESYPLLTGLLREEWGFDGLVVSDWGAVNNRVLGLEAGMDLEMPASKGITDAQIVRAVQEGALSEEVLNTAVERILKLVFRYTENRIEAEFDKEADHKLAVKIEEESAVLLKNEKQLLPLKPDKKIAFIGGFAQAPRYQGGGSSHINSFKVTNALNEVKNIAEVQYAEGFPIDRDELKDELLKEAIEVAKSVEVAVIFAGLPDAFESEGYDRSHMRLPDCQNTLIQAVCKVQPNTVVVLHNGSPVEMPWIHQVAGILEVYLGGQGVGEATVNLLFGKANPSGKLAESFPLRLEDNPSYLNFPGDANKVEYKEGVYIGYRYYDKKAIPVLFPFGHGLSYTSFAYSNLRLEKDEITDQETLIVSVDITNTGQIAGKEAVQLYVSDKTGTPNRPLRELKGFEKVSLNPGETKSVDFVLDKRSFAWYNTDISDWYCATGTFGIEIGKSSREIMLEKDLKVTSTIQLPFVVHENTTLGELLRNPKTVGFLMEHMNMNTGALLGDPSNNESSSAISDEMARQMMENAPIRALRSFIGLEEAMMQQMIAHLNKLLQQ